MTYRVGWVDVKERRSFNILNVNMHSAVFGLEGFPKDGNCEIAISASILDDGVLVANIAWRNYTIYSGGITRQYNGNEQHCIWEQSFKLMIFSEEQWVLDSNKFIFFHTHPIHIFSIKYIDNQKKVSTLKWNEPKKYFLEW